MPAVPNAVVVLSTAPTAEVAEQLARALVERRLAACVNILPGVRSIYAWEGTVHDEPELQLVIKTTPTLQAQVVAALEALHPFDVPEALVLPTHGGSQAYLSWIHEVTA